MPAKMARSALGRRSGCPKVTVAVRTSLLSCRKTANIQASLGVIRGIPGKVSGNSRQHVGNR